MVQPMSEIPTKDQARIELATLEVQINWHSPDIRALEEWLGWRRCQLAFSAMAEGDDSLRAKLYGQAHMCQDLINLAKEARKAVANSTIK